MFKKKLWKKMLYSFTMMLTMLVLLSYVSYSWIKREWTPSIKQDGIEITTNGSLVLNLGGGDHYQEDQSINEILKVTSFVLQPVSNATGESDDFFTLDFTGGLGEEKYKWLNIRDYADGTAMGIANGYIEFTFTLYAPDSVDGHRYVYIDEESYIECADLSMPDVAKSIRMSISTQTHGTKVFGIYGAGELTQKAITSEVDSGTNRPYADEAKYYQQYDPADDTKCIPADTIIKNGVDTNKELHATVQLRMLSEFNGSTAEHCLFSMDAGKDAKGEKVTVRIWVEGTDENCYDQISGKAINLKLKFASCTADAFGSAAG